MTSKTQLLFPVWISTSFVTLDIVVLFDRLKREHSLPHWPKQPRQNGVKSVADSAPRNNRHSCGHNG